MALDVLHLPSQTGGSDVQIFTGNSLTAGTSWRTWEKPRGKSMVNIVLIGKGGNGGLGAVGNNSTAAGGGGGGSGAQTSITIPASLIPDVLFLSLAAQSTTTLVSYVCVGAPIVGSPWNNVLLVAQGGGNGGNASGATPGAVGAAGAIATVATMPLGWRYSELSLVGQAGIIGGVAVAGANITIPVTGLWVTGGAGGGGLPATAATGTVGGNITGSGIFVSNLAPPATSVATTPPANGSNGYQPVNNLMYFYGGAGAGSTHGSATTTGLVAAVGGFGGYGCGGGGNGGALTGTTARAAGDVGMGGSAICIITCW